MLPNNFDLQSGLEVRRFRPGKRDQKENVFEDDQKDVWKINFATVMASLQETADRLYTRDKR